MKRHCFFLQADSAAPLAMGLPVLSTRHSGIPELVEDGRSGYLVSERDVGALADRLDSLLGSPERWPAMGEAGRRRVESQFDINRLNDALVERIRLMLAGAAWGAPTETQLRP
ncbi:MAG: glycosyltransferase [Gammaproteobacteria bacterium]